jgi:mRNA-degrading endonuclease toxin of MazEF toxin-antitoxin module
LAAPLTTKKHTGNWYLKISLNDSYVILNQIRPIDIDRFRESMGCISEDELRNIIDSYIQLIKYI